ncbi:MAG: molybdenum cofactor biosynthesis protein MoaE [Gemmatimonadota bacterium]|nr:MAG: molybdenum cofactor biosynthesis protein MoaE [Gemmatimonadota bacterium]
MTFLGRDPIDIADLAARVSDPGHGGTAIFVGTVRRSPDDGPVVAIDYSGYEEMAESELVQILGQTQERWPGARVALQHRLGRIVVGEASVAVAVSTPHRAQAFEACRYVVEELKKRVPIWKKELMEDGQTRWSDDGDREEAAK